MLKAITRIFRGKKEEETREYAGFSDFFLRAPVNEKKKILTEVAHKANADQLRAFREAQLKVKTNSI